MFKFRQKMMVLGTVFATGLHGETHVCNLDTIYQPGVFEYFLPKSTLASFLDGAAFDSEVSYTEKERALLQADIEEIYEKIEREQLSPRREAVMTAGAPGAGKTFLLRQHMLRNSKKRNFAYIDPDDICLKSMKRTYLKDLKDTLISIQRQNFFSEEEENLTELAAKQVLYNHWRPGSNAANHLILANLIRQGLPFYFGTTSTSPTVANLFKLLKEENYHIRLLHITASDDTRWQSILKENRTFLHTTAEDIRNKGKFFYQRLQTYFEWADTIEFYYRSESDQDAVLAAIWTKTDLTIINQTAYNAIQNIHNESCHQLQKEELLWRLPTPPTIAIAVNQ